MFKLFDSFPFRDKVMTTSNSNFHLDCIGWNSNKSLFILQENMIKFWPEKPAVNQTTENRNRITQCVPDNFSYFARKKRVCVNN